MIKFLDPIREYNIIKEKIKEAITRVLESGNFIGGIEVEKLETEIAKFCGTKYAISVNSGTDALYLALKGLGIGNGSEVITTPFTFIATSEAIINAGAKPVFVDIDPESFNIDPLKIEEKITKNTKAILVVHLFGRMADMGKLMEIAKQRNLLIIEDCAQAIGAASVKSFGEPKAGSIGDCGCFSFFPSKNLGCYGDGGMITTNNSELADKMRLLKNHGSSKDDKYKNMEVGMNSRLDAIQAAMLLEKLKYLNDWNNKRRELANRYHEGLKDIKEIENPLIGEGDVFNQYTLRCKDRDDLQEFLEGVGIETKIYYPKPLHLQPALKFLNYKEGEYPQAEKAAKEVLSLPIYPQLEDKEQNFIIEKVKEYYAK